MDLTRKVFNYWFVPVVAATSGALHPATMRLLYDFARLKTDAAEHHAIANSIRRGATFARLQMAAAGKHWAAPYASSLLARSRAWARCGAEAPAPASATLVPASRV